ncbi:DNA recombination protein RmuC [Chitinophaga nivalis]|uniref:DNA recombination protein RmuC n=1 Tax=Chitinophaga nivalis TaxID=2991709 RepID=A0ABT3IW64_9BACT|nr:DNA recombination protein RmuC [Chitinophaga nivalis]MCW3462365.1 DNA recombination protein RmuC [Chitinophaga nivalis]MCW3487944.1 DNA recombination protein RmuC [Chitinophaga nivalis]
MQEQQMQQAAAVQQQEKYNLLEARQEYLQNMLDDKALLVKEKQQQLERINDEFASMMAEQSRLMEQKKYLQEQLNGEKERLQQLQQDFKVQFENIAQQLLQRISGTFMEQNQLKMDDLLKPLAEKIDNFRSSVQQSLVAETSQRAELKNELQRLLQLNQTLSKEANNLTNALKADTKKQGNWGEMILERVLEASGLEKGVHYFTQDAQWDEAGQLRRPDLVLHLPENRQVVIDSKVSLKAYEQYCSGTSDEERKQALKLHLQSVKNHVNELSRKAYHTLYNNTTDFVVLFIPIEPAYALAVMQEEDLYDYAFRRKIILVSVPSLLATLRIIDAMWRLDKQNKNAEEIVRQGSALYDKFVGFSEDMGLIGDHLRRSQQVYDSALNKLTTGNGNLVGRAEKMRRLGLDNKKTLPKDLTANAATDREETNTPAALPATASTTDYTWPPVDPDDADPISPATDFREP